MKTNTPSSIRHFVTEHRLLLFVFSVHFLSFFALNQFINPHPDMVDHWVWSRFLSLSYYEHPPMIALLMRFITTLGGNTETTLEIASQFTTLFIIFQIYWISFLHFNKRTAQITLILLVSTPYFTLGSIFLHITQPFLIFWMFALHLYLRFHEALCKAPQQTISQNKEARNYLLWLGVIAGLGALSKYIMLLFYMGMLLHFLLYKKIRHHFFSPWPYIAGAISLLIFSPVLFWNLQNDWVSFKFQFGRGLSGAIFGKNFLEMTVGHLLLFSPFWSWWCLRNTWRLRTSLNQEHSKEVVLVVLSVFPLFFFSLMSLRGSIADPHWMNIAYIGFMMLAGSTLNTLWENKKLQKRLYIGLGINVLMIALLFFHAFSPLLDTMQYELRNSEYLRRNGVPESVIEQLKAVNQRIYGTKKFLKQVKETLSPEDYKQYKNTIKTSAMLTLSDPTHPILAWDTTGKQIEELLQQKQIPLPQFILSREYQLSSTLTLYLSNHPFPHSFEKKERNQWSLPQDIRKENRIFVCDLPQCESGLSRYYNHFEEPLSFVGSIITQKYGRVVRSLEIYR